MLGSNLDGIKSDFNLHAFEKNKCMHYDERLSKTHTFTLFLIFKGYFGDPWNVFDFIIVIGSVVDVMLSEIDVSIIALLCFPCVVPQMKDNMLETTYERLLRLSICHVCSYVVV